MSQMLAMKKTFVMKLVISHEVVEDLKSRDQLLPVLFEYFTCKAIFVMAEACQKDQSNYFLIQCSSDSIQQEREDSKESKDCPFELFEPEHLVLAPCCHEHGICVFHQP